MKLKPLGQRVLLKRHEDSTYGSGILVKPDTYKKATLEGFVLEVGPECRSVKVGDRVIYGQYAWWELPRTAAENFREVLVVNEEDIIVVMEES